MWMWLKRRDVKLIIKSTMKSIADYRKIPIDNDSVDRVSEELENVLFYCASNYIDYSNYFDNPNSKTIKQRLKSLYHTREILSKSPETIEEQRFKLWYHNRKILSKSLETIEGYDDKSFEYILDMDEQVDIQPNDLNFLKEKL